MYNKKFIAIAVAVLVIITAVGIGVGVHQFKKADIPAQNQSQNDKTDNSQAKDNQDQKEDKKEDNQDKQNEQAAEKDDKKTSESKDSKEPVKEKTPVFMYFVSETDSNYNDALKIFKELEAEYKGKIEFDLKNVTKDPALLENFSLVKDNTPALIMDGKEGITGMLFKNTDKSELKAEIEKALK